MFFPFLRFIREKKKLKINFELTNVTLHKVSDLVPHFFKYLDLHQEITFLDTKKKHNLKTL